MLDVGCDRGEFPDLLSEHGITARGLDLNHEMIEVCRARGLHADEGDAVAYLAAQPELARPYAPTVLVRDQVIMREGERFSSDAAAC